MPERVRGESRGLFFEKGEERIHHVLHHFSQKKECCQRCGRKDSCSFEEKKKRKKGEPSPSPGIKQQRKRPAGDQWEIEKKKKREENCHSSTPEKKKDVDA